MSHDTALQNQLCQFFCSVRKSGKKEYAPSSLHKRLHEIFDGQIKQIQDNQDTSCKKTDALEIIEVNIPHEKNNAGDAKNPYNAGRHNYIPADQPNYYSPVADILLYQSKRPKD
ncbi:12970_t:CDS:2, partial [Funneliformis caledonium]